MWAYIVTNIILRVMFKNMILQPVGAFIMTNMAVSRNWGAFLVRALLFGVDVLAPDVLKLPDRWRLPNSLKNQMIHRLVIV